MKSWNHPFVHVLESVTQWNQIYVLPSTLVPLPVLFWLSVSLSRWASWKAALTQVENGRNSLLGLHDYLLLVSLPLYFFSLLLGIFPLSLVDVVLPYGSVCSPSFFPGFSLFCLYLPPCTPKALRCTACGILFAWTGIEFRPLSVKVQSPNHWTTREFPTYYFKTIIMYLKCLLLSWGPTTYSDF